jgi:hypothetical protein
MPLRFLFRPLHPQTFARHDFSVQMGRFAGSAATRIAYCNNRSAATVNCFKNRNDRECA